MRMPMDNDGQGIESRGHQLPSHRLPDMAQAQGDDIHLKDYLRVLSRRRWILISFFFCVVVTAAVSVFMKKPVYTATVTIRIGGENPNVLTAGGILETRQYDRNYYRTQYRILRSKNIAARVIRDLNLEESAGSGGKSAHGGKGIPPALIGAFLRKISVKPVPDSQLVNVSFSAHDPVLARDAANAIAAAYMNYSMESKIDAGQRTTAWLQEQLQITKTRLEDSERALDNYAAGNGIYMQGKDDNTRSLIDSELVQTSDSLTKAVIDRIARQSLYMESRDGAKIPEELKDTLIQRLRSRYFVLAARYDGLLNVYKPAYPLMRRLKKRMDSIQSAIRQEKQEICQVVKAQYQGSLDKENRLRGLFDKENQMAFDYQRKMVQYRILEREVQTNQELYQNLLQNMKRIGVSATMTATNIQVLDKARLPASPSSPRRGLNMALALALGLAGGSGLAFFADYLDNTVKDAEEIEKRMKLAPLGIVPYQKKIEEKGLLITGEEGRGEVAEAFRSIGTFILFSSSPTPPKTILVTSPRENEGKTTVACNSAVVLASHLGKGILIDADFRKPHLHRTFGLENGEGLSNYLSGNLEFQADGFIRKTPVENLDLVLAGPLPPDPSALLGSAKMKEFVGRLAGMYNFVIIDSAPVLGMADSAVLSSFVDGVIAVVMSGQTTREELKETKRIFDYMGSNVLGVIVNGIKPSERYGYYPYYGSYAYGGNGRKK